VTQAHGGMHRRRAGDRFCPGDTASQPSGMPRLRSLRDSGARSIPTRTEARRLMSHLPIGLRTFLSALQTITLRPPARLRTRTLIATGDAAGSALLRVVICPPLCVAGGRIRPKGAVSRAGQASVRLPGFCESRSVTDDQLGATVTAGCTSRTLELGAGFVGRTPAAIEMPLQRFRAVVLREAGFTPRPAGRQSDGSPPRVRV
jgi:hypothetical protein